MERHRQFSRAGQGNSCRAGQPGCDQPARRPEAGAGTADWSGGAHAHSGPAHLHPASAAVDGGPESRNQQQRGSGMKLDIVMFGLSITSSWGNGHATTYRALIKALAARGHRITFLERDMPWYRDNRDLTSSPYCRIHLYDSLKHVSQNYGALVAAADVVLLGSFVPDGAALGDWITSTARGVTAFYDIDTPVTLSMLADNTAEYISPSIIPRFNLYLSFTGGPTLEL